jgi:acetyltransferase-like isoleucine patch superfamily enzyme
LRGKIKVEDTGSQISVGAGTTMENGYLGAYEGTSITVGNDCMFSDQVGIRTGDMHSILDSATQDRLNPSDSITIQSRVWLCRGVTVLKGYTIGPDTVVGGYSIVTDSLPVGVLAVGSPAKVIRQGIIWKRERVGTQADPC